MVQPSNGFRMQTRRRRLIHWICGIGSVLVLAMVMVVTCVYLNTQNRSSAEIESSGVVSESAPTAELVVEPIPEDELPKIDFVVGSVEEACGFNEYVPYDYDGIAPWPKSPYNANGKFVALESDECRNALEMYMNTSNPYHFLFDTPNQASLLKFVVLDEPFTFERIFANPADDLTRMQDALSRSECLLTGDETNWELRETCHADAFLNFALVNVFCFDEGVNSRVKPRYRERDNPTPEQDRLMWKQRLEDKWVEQKCEGLDPTLELTAEHYPDLYARVMSLQEPDADKEPLELLVELAARFGNEAAGLTQAVYRPGWNTWSFDSEGYKFGRMFGRDTNLVSNSEWSLFATKWGPSTDRFQQTFYMLAKLEARRPDPRDEIEFDWEFVARHLCEPPYEPVYVKQTDESGKVTFVEKEEYPSCQEVIHQIRQSDMKFPPLLRALDKFEQIALELDVYE